MEPFVHLHVHTEYSLLDGANPIGKLVDAAVADGHTALAITDHGNLFGAMEFYQACHKRGVKPILGCEFYIAEDSMLKPHSRRANPYSHLTLMAHNEKGWENMMALSSAGFIEGQHFRPRIDMDYLSERASGLTCLSGCLSGPVNKRLRVEDEPGAIQTAGMLQDMFGKEHFYLEIMRNGIALQDKMTEGMTRLQGQMNAPLIATNDIHYLRHEDCAAQDAMICLNTGSRLDDPDRWRMDSDTLYFRTREEMNRIFSDIPEALRNTQLVADQVNVELEIGRLRLPVFTPEDGRTPEQLFRELCERGFKELYPEATQEARERLEYEIGVITEMGFISYFLIVWDLIRYARDSGIPVGPGRGSAAGSIVAYALGITRIDPLEYDLIFERFLNPARISMPDIDIDFCKDRREEMIHYTRERYGDENVCQIITFGKLKAKNALRDMGRIMEVPLPEVDRVTKKIPEGPGVKLGKAIDDEPDLKKWFEESELHKKWFDLALKVEGLPRNSGIHAAGVIIADQPLREIVPLAKVSGNITTQWDMKYAEQFGLLKMDFLGLRTLSILQEAVNQVERRLGETIILDDLELNDEDTYELLRKADTEGVFQLESGGMRKLLAQIKPTHYEDIIAVLALFRPGPLGSGLHETYARRKHGEEKVSFQHEILEDILAETYGVLIYQEQIMRVAQFMGGFSLSDADSLRKAMGKKDAAMMGNFEGQFLEGGAERDVPPEIAKEIWDMMVKFAEYGFNKSHSAAYAMVTYQAAWMKAHYPAEFFAASFTYEASDTDKLRSLIEDARRHGVHLLPPCVNASDSRFTVIDGETVRFGLEAIKGVGGGAADSIIELRKEQENGHFTNADEVFIGGVAASINRGTFESLTKAGAMDSFSESRVHLLPQLEDRIRVASALAKDRAKGQGLLFDAAPSPTPAVTSAEGDSPPPHGSAAELDPAGQELLLQYEKESLGFYLTSHPLDNYRDILGGVSPWDSRSAKEAGSDAILALPGIVSQLNVRGTRNDPAKKYAKFKVEDLHGATNAIIFPRTWEEVHEFIKEDFVGLFHGRLQVSNDEAEMIVDKIEPLGSKDDMRLQGSLEVRLHSDQSPPIKEMQEILLRHAGEDRVRFIVHDGKKGARFVRAGKEWSVKLSSTLVDELNLLLGADSAKLSMERGTVKRERGPAWSRN
ncbi:MAG: DNA polymerase III subunit alpha [Planctomycetes bacterium]|nr:DNA polymerase III subunit alpha [Planctomycetota bacterium]MCP4861455.1 DNA polymerase III subunit alpha [Planctomycetota bacterium]